MPRKPKMPKYVGLLVHRGAGLASARRGYSISLTICPEDIGVSCDATNAEMVEAVVTDIKRSAAERERKAIADAVLNAKVNPFSVWRLVVEGGAPIMRHTEGRAASLPDWIEHGMYRPEAAATTGKETP
jgi:hypothetical protein